MTRLAFEDRVHAVIGSSDSASTHVAQQVATKALLPVVSPISSDPTLTHVRVPWIFRLAPDDASQARVLVDSGIVGRGFGRIGLVTSTDHSSRMAASARSPASAARASGDAAGIGTAKGLSGS